MMLCVILLELVLCLLAEHVMENGKNSLSPMYYVPQLVNNFFSVVAVTKWDIVYNLLAKAANLFAMIRNYYQEIQIRFLKCESD